MEWISVRKQLPERGSTVKVLIGGSEDERVATYYPKEYPDGFMESMGWSWVFEDEGENFSRITHWMPLPEPPKE